MTKTGLVGLVLLFISLSLSGCSLFRVYKIDIQQGNIITQAMVNKLKPGMTMAQVEQQLGSPLMIAPFRTDRLYYVYSNKPSYKRIHQQKLTIYFRNNRLTHYTTDLLPAPR